jgi:MFS family permease
MGKGGFGRDFYFWFTARFATNLARTTLEVALIWRVFKLTDSPLALGLMGLAEAVPFLLTSFWAGHLVDRHHKRPFMTGSAAAMLACAAVLFLFGHRVRTTFLFYAATAFLGAASSFANVSSSVYVQLLVPQEDYSRAVAWNLAAFTTSVILGPILGGWLLSVHSARMAFAVGGGLLALSLVLFQFLRFNPELTPGEGESALRRIADGIRFVRSRRLMLACMSLDMIAVLFGDAVAVFPFFAERFHAGPLGFGLLRASPALGSALLSLAHATRPLVTPSWGRIKRMVALFGLFMIAFALSRNLWLSCLFLMLAGAVDGVSVIIRQNVYRTNTPDEYRGRVSAMSGIFISASNEIGAFESGLAAKLLGAVPSVVFGGCMTLATVAFMSWRFRDLPQD